MKAIAVIPARYGSTRFPGKPLAMINGKPMIQRVYEQCMKAKGLRGVIVATDDNRIVECVKGFGGASVMTSAKHESGTDRVCEAIENIACEVVLNVQGDEPYIHPSGIDKLVGVFGEDRNVRAATLAVKFRNTDEVNDPNKVKVITDVNGDAVYFSRSVIPSDSSGKFPYLKHLGIYAFRKSFLFEFSSMKKTKLEKAEKLEQLRILENGYKIRVLTTPYDSVAVDTPQDVLKLQRK